MVVVGLLLLRGNQLGQIRDASCIILVRHGEVLEHKSTLACIYALKERPLAPGLELRLDEMDSREFRAIQSTMDTKRDAVDLTFSTSLSLCSSAAAAAAHVAIAAFVSLSPLRISVVMTKMGAGKSPI
jgi:hypothetical protein